MLKQIIFSIYVRAQHMSANFFNLVIRFVFSCYKLVGLSLNALFLKNPPKTYKHVTILLYNKDSSFVLVELILLLVA